jgi:hypothetical protein
MVDAEDRSDLSRGQTIGSKCDGCEKALGIGEFDIAAKAANPFLG